VDLSGEPGIRQAARIFGRDLAAAIAASWSDVDPEFARAICNYAYGTMYARDVLPARDRELCVVMTLTALDKQPQLAAHIQAALHCGATRAEVTEAILQAHLYAGIPATMNGLATLRTVLASARFAHAGAVPGRPRRKQAHPRRRE
jgi:4-carboxymuconolactone decarboxylase